MVGLEISDFWYWQKEQAYWGKEYLHMNEEENGIILAPKNDPFWQDFKIYEVYQRKIKLKWKFWTGIG